MEEIRVTLSANAGICVRFGSHCIWVDALHEEKQPGFSAVSEELLQKVLDSDAFRSPDQICVTHCHPDHYSKRMIKLAMGRWPQTQLCMPESEFDGQILVAGERFCLKQTDYSLEFIRLPHEGAQYSGVKHYGILLRVAQKNILIAGDCETASPALTQALGEREIDLAILNFPWVTLTKGRNFVKQILKPKQVIVCHLPFEADDVSGFCNSAQRNAQLLSDTMDIRLLCQPMQTEIIKI